MSWEEYKQQRNNNSNSSWQEYKKKRNSELSINQQILLPTANQNVQTNLPVSDADKYGTFSNGYQPKGISGHGSLSKTGKTINVQIGESDTYNEITGKKDKIFNKQNVWQAEDGTTWVWDGKSKAYKPYEQSSETGLMNNKNEQNILPIANQNIINDSISALKQDEQRKQMAGIEETINPIEAILGTNADVGLGLTKGGVRVSEGIANLLTGVTANVAEGFGNEEYANRLRKTVKEDSSPVSNKISQLQEKIDKYSLSGDIFDQLVEGAGYSGALMSAELVTGPIGMNLLTFASATGSGYSEALQNENATNAQIWTKAIGSGSVETLTENLFGFFGRFGVDETIANKLAEQVSSGIGKMLVRQGVTMGSEAAEEAISAALNDFIVDRLVDFVGGEEGAKFTKKLTWDRVKEVGKEMLLAAGSAGLMGGAANINAINQTAKQYDVGIREALNIYENNLDTQAKLENEKSKLEKQIKQEQKNGNNTSELQSQLNQIDKMLGIEEQTTEGNITQASQSNISDLNNQVQQTSLYQYEKSDNAKIDAFRQQLANNGFDNSETTQNFAKNIEKIIEDKNYTVNFADLGQNVNGKIEKVNGETIITLNPKSEQGGLFVTTHELTHAVGTDELKTMINQYAKKHKGFNEAVQSLKQTYGTNEISDEVMCDIIAQNIGNEEFLNSLTLEQPSIAKRFYNKVISILNKLTRNSNEWLFWQDVKGKLQNSYREIQGSNIAEGTESYSIGGKIGIDNAVKQDTSNKALLDNYNKAVQMINSGENNLKVKKETGWYKDTQTGDIKFEFSDKDMGLKKQNLVPNREYTLKELLKHDLLFDFYPSLEEYKVTFTAKNNDGGISNSKQLIKINQNKIGNELEIKTTLIHEIQHAIQNIEKFQEGTSIKNSGKYGYLNNTGEIEAEDVSDRYKNDITGQRKTILPETGKKKPKHPYIKNDAYILEKMANSIYNYFNGYNKGGKNTNAKNNQENSRENLGKKELARGQVYSNQEHEKSLQEIRETTKTVEDSKQSSFSLQKNKQKQLEIIQKSNPMLDDYHTGIRSIEDIKTLEETLLDEDWKDYDEFNPDLTRKDIEDAIKTGKITVYSSNEIENGTFISPSKMEAESYSGSGKVYSKEVNIKDIAWIDPTQGQYAKVESAEYSKNNNKWKEWLDKTFPKQEQKSLKDMRLPIAENNNIDYNLPESEVSKNGEQIRTENDRLQKEENERVDEPINSYFERVKELTRNVKKGLAEDRAKLNEVVTESLQGLPLSKTKVQKFVRELANNKTLTQEDIRTFLDNNNKFTEKTVDEYSKQIRKDISNYKFKLNDRIRNELKYKYGNIPRNIKLSNNGASVDSIYQELSSKYPDIFSNKIINEGDQAAEIIEFMRNVAPISVEETTLLNQDELKELSQMLYGYKQFFDEAKDYYGQKFLDEKRRLKYAFTEDAKENKPKKLTRKAVRENIINEWGITAEELSNAKDLTAINYQLTDPVRVNEKVFGRELGQRINDLTVNQTKHNTAEKTRWLNKERAEIEELGIKARTKESAAVQKYGEKQFVDKNGDTHSYGDAELASEFSDVKTQEKIKKAATVIRNKYDNYIDQINEVLTSLGYDAIPKRQDYMRHFQELGDIFSQTGVPFNLNDMKAEDLPTDINGLTEFNRPGKNWFASAQKRYGNKTTYDAITGIDGYLEGAGNLIFHTQDIQNYRALSGLIRDSFGASKGFDNLEGLTDVQAQKRIDKIMDNHLSKYAAWLDEQANSLAGKKGAIDRGFERAVGRRGYKMMNTLKSQVGSNMTGYNIRSAMTNFISTTIAAAKTKKLAMVKGTVSTIQNMLKNDGFIDKSDFLTARFGSDSLSQKLWQKASNAGQVFMTASDYFTSNLIVRSKYFEGLQKGMTESEAIKYADDFGARVMGDRSQGATAEAFNSKTLGLLTQFQLETNNQWQYMIHDTIMDYQKNSEVNGGMKAGATALFQMGQLAAFSYFFNELFEALTGSRSAFDPIEILKKLFGDDDDDKDFDEKLSDAGELLVDNIPFGNLITGGGRIPISEAFTGIGTVGKKLTNQKDKYGNDITWEDVGQELKESLPYWILPTGYSQAKKTVQGLSMYDENLPVAGSYTDSGNLRYTVDDDAKSKVQAGLFGRWASQSAQEYIDSGYKSISKNKIDELKELGMTSSEYREYRAGLAGQKKQEDKLEYINSLDVTDKQKSIMASNELKRDIDMSTYDDYGSFEEFDFSYKNPEKYDWLKNNNISYKKYKNNKEAYDNAYKNPEKYEMSKIITKDYIQYNKYAQNINDIKADKDSNGKTINGSRKDKVEEYVNSLDLNIAQKAILIKSTNTFKYNDYNDEIIDYINGLNMGYDKKKKTLESLGMTVDNNGNISW